MKTNKLFAFIFTCIYFFLFLPLLLPAQQGKDGARTVSSQGVIYNRYAVLASSIPSGSPTVTVTNINDLSASAISGAANNPYSSNLLGYGDLIMIIKMQGASIRQTNNASYGEILDYNGTGTYEFAVVQAVSGNTINLCLPTIYGYTVGGTSRAQVIRVPRLSSLTINAGSPFAPNSLTGRPWGSVGNTGGVISVEVFGNAVVNGRIIADGIGFRAGSIDDYTSASSSLMTDYVSASFENGAEKGEGIAGNQTDYDAMGGRYNRGAPANGGGGGNGHNAGGGGGASAGSVSAWTGMGNPDVSNPAWATAWNLEAAGFANTTSSGGGRGGYTYSQNDFDALSISPGNLSWAGNSRYNVGGYGGRPLNYSGNKLFMGGGGGAGDANDFSSTNGGRGGGIIHLTVYGNLSGSGAILANGSNAGNSIAPHKDALGGGGGGGSILMNVQGTLTGVSMSAGGGSGGIQNISTDEAEGPGGGGGGGYIFSTPTSVSGVVNGGLNGTTTSHALNEFVPNGATVGGSGQFSNSLTFLSMQPLACFILPMKLISFSAQINKHGNVEVKWVTANEEEDLQYVVEQSADMNNWIKMNEQFAKRNGDQMIYKAELKEPIEPVLYFRLKIIKPDQSYRYSDIRIIRLENNKGILIQNGYDQITVLFKTKPQNVRLFSAAGQLIKDNISPGTSVVTIDKATLKKGVYYLQLIIDNKITSLPFVK